MLCRGNLLQPQELMGFLLILNRLTGAKYIYPVFPHNLGEEVNLFTIILRWKKTKDECKLVIHKGKSKSHFSY